MKLLMLLSLLIPSLGACTSGEPCHPPAEADDTLRVHVVDPSGGVIASVSFALDDQTVEFICEDDYSVVATCPSGWWRQGIVGAHQLAISASGYTTKTIVVDTGSHENCGSSFAMRDVVSTVQLNPN